MKSYYGEECVPLNSTSGRVVPWAYISVSGKVYIDIPSLGVIEIPPRRIRDGWVLRLPWLDTSPRTYRHVPLRSLMAHSWWPSWVPSRHFLYKLVFKDGNRFNHALANLSWEKTFNTRRLRRRALATAREVGLTPAEALTVVPSS